jgi:thiol:disulfide interchange protein
MRIWAAAAGVLLAAACSAPALVRNMANLRPGLHFQMGPAEIYSDTANAKEQIRQAILTAGVEHKHVLLVFGGNWCVDCHLLELYFHDPGNAALLAANYVLVDVNIGEYDRNLDLARRYGIPLSLGVPALVVLDGAGHVLYVQRHGEFENMRVLDSAAVTAFLEKWKPGARHGARRSQRRVSKTGRGE